MAKEKVKVETRKDEVRYFTSEPKEMLNKYLVADVFQKWTDDYMDEDAGEVVTIETTQSFIVHTFDTDRALMIISHYLKTWEEKIQKEHEEKGYSKYEIRDFNLCIEKAGPMPVGAFVPKEFTMAYNEPQ